MNFNNQLKIDRPRTIKDCFAYFSKNTLDIKTAMDGINDGNFITLGDVSFGFTQEIVIQWNKFLISILKIKNLMKIVSLKTIDKELKNLFKNYLVNNEIDLFVNFHDIIQKLEKYRSNLNYHYFIVTGLISEKVYQFDNIKIGDFNHKCPISKLSFSEKIHLNNKEIIQFKKDNGSFNQMDDYWLKELLHIISTYEKHTVLEISNFGDDENSLDQSISDAESFVNELIFLSKNTSNLDFDIKLNLSNQEKAIPLMVNYNANKISTPPKKLIHPVIFNLESSSYNGIHIGKIFKKLNSPLHSKTNENELIEKLKTAINWYSSSLKSQNNRENFLFCAIGMEALLTTGRDSITKSLAENTAFLIAAKNKESRKYIYNQMAYLYSQRSGIAHGGNANIELKDLNQIRYYLSVCITTIISKIQKDEINNAQDLYEYLENQKFG